MFKSILIANRGEIAVRIIRACKEMDIESVSVYSTADKDCIHTKLSDKSICIGPPPPAKSYLNMDNIISAAKVAGCDAIHPGYGFLAENPKFVDACLQNELVFIGPPTEAITLAGNKSNAIDIMKKNKIPVIPGSSGDVGDIKKALNLG
ncbi:MAG: biotin carboxylase N-terminal domain-containing protein, partial [Actinomycetota bacterium]